MSQEPEYRISSLEGQLRLCQERLTEAIMHNREVIAAEEQSR